MKVDWLIENFLVLVFIKAELIHSWVEKEIEKSSKQLQLISVTAFSATVNGRGECFPDKRRPHSRLFGCIIVLLALTLSSKLESHRIPRTLMSLNPGSLTNAYCICEKTENKTGFIKLGECRASSWILSWAETDIINCEPSQRWVLMSWHPLRSRTEPSEHICLRARFQQRLRVLSKDSQVTGLVFTEGLWGFI